MTTERVIGSSGGFWQQRLQLVREAWQVSCPTVALDHVQRFCVPARRAVMPRVLQELHMTDQFVIRRAHEDDCEFIAGLVPSLLEFGSPARDDATAHTPSFRDVLVSAVRAQGPRSTVYGIGRADPIGRDRRLHS